MDNRLLQKEIVEINWTDHLGNLGLFITNRGLEVFGSADGLYY